jgi:GTP-binding protein
MQITESFLQSALDSLRREIFENLHVAMPGILVSYDAETATADVQPPAQNGRRLKIFYVTQQSVCPPTFVFFINDEKLMHFAYKRYLENYFRKTFDFSGTPLRFVIRERTKE